MLYHYSFNGVDWLDLHQPTSEELDELVRRNDLNPMIADELAHPSDKDYVERFDHTILGVFHFPAFQHTHDENTTIQELDMVILPDTVITVHYDTIDAIHKFRNMAETATILDRSSDTDSPGVLFKAIMKKMYKSVYHEVEYVEHWIDDIEDKIFENREREMVRALSLVNRRLLDMKKTIRVHNELLHSLERTDTRTFGDDFQRSIREVRSERQKIKHAINGNIELVGEFRSTNNSLLSTKQNDTIQVLTGLAYIILPVTTVATVFGMRATNGMPFIGRPHDFWIILSIMLVAAIIVGLYFKWKRFI